MQKNSKLDLLSTDRRLKAISESSCIGYFITDISSSFLEVNDGLCILTGLSEEKLLSLNLQELEKDKDNLKTLDSYKKLVVSGNIQFTTEIRAEENEGFTANIVLTYLAKEKLVIGILIPIEIPIESSNVELLEKEKKRFEYLSYHDSLTGLYNKNYLDKELKKWGLDFPLPFSVIVGDINGLKLINDTYGISTGDHVISTVAKIMSNSCPEDSIVVRKGDDEFSVLLPNTDKKKLSTISKKIKKECSDYSINESKPYLLSISLGYETTESPDVKVQDLLQKAEIVMHKHKLLETRSIRSNTVSLILKTLQEKNIETQEHFDNMKMLCNKIGYHLGLSDSLIADLDLLSVLHDVGKIAISDSIINKNAKLTKAEKELIKKHSEFGFHITQSAIEFQHLSDYILSHHEKWDGTGYPNQLRGNDIPLLSRIIAIVDAYDAMTNLRPYREALPEGYAVDEIINCSGTQFDPHIARIFVEKVLGKTWKSS